jgi:dipeptidyl aminopeptidase/acylaminoacyl peptidase
MQLRDLFQCRSAMALDEDAGGRLLVASNLPGSFQLYEHDGGELRQLTDFAEPVDGRYLPGSRRGVLAMDAGGNERHQLYLFDLDAPPGADRTRLEALTAAPQYVHRLIGVSPDGRRIGYVSNRGNGVDFDVFVLDVGTRDQLCVYGGGGWCQAGSGYSPDGRWLSVLRPGQRPLDNDLLVIDVTTGEVRVVGEHPHEAASIGPPAWVDGDSFFASSDVDRDLAAIVHVDLTTGHSSTAVERGYDLECFASADGTTLLVVGNDGGACRPELYAVGDAGQLTALGDMPMPGRGVIWYTLATPPPILSPDGSRVTYTFSSPQVPGDVWCFDRASGVLGRLTTSPGFGSPPGPAIGGDLAEPTTHELTSFDGERVPVFVYRPKQPAPATPATAPPAGPATAPPAGPAGAGEPEALLPVVLYIHGGPEGQSVLAFTALIQGLVSAGYAVVVPNVRGSTGYGKRYASLDDTTRRLDSVADLAAIHAWLRSQGLDPDRAALMGGSYGGYMVLAGCAFQPDLWAAGVDIVGISDLVTFLENTSAYRRSHREHEYGSLVDDREFLERASPLRSVDAIRAPLFVIHGANDPRVPLSEAEQLVSSLRRRDVACELLVYADEGHGLQKLANRLDAYPRAVEFLNGVLGQPPAAGGLGQRSTVVADGHGSS